MKMAKWSNHATTRATDTLGPNEVAEGYIPCALRIMETTFRLDINDRDHQETLAKAKRVLHAAGIRPNNA